MLWRASTQLPVGSRRLALNLRVHVVAVTGRPERTGQGDGRLDLLLQKQPMEASRPPRQVELAGDTRPNGAIHQPPLREQTLLTGKASKST